jgi:hypothetical protein
MSEAEILVQKIKAAIQAHKDKESNKINNLVKQINKVIHK